MIYWTDFHDFFSHKMENICVNVVNTVQFFGFVKGRCHGNQFCGKITYPRHLSLWHLRKNFVSFGPVTPGLTGLIFYFFNGDKLSQDQLDDLIDELPVEKRHLSKLIIICRI